MLELVGAALIAYALWLLWRPGAFLWAGVACFAASAMIELQRRSGAPAKRAGVEIYIRPAQPWYGQVGQEHHDG